MTCDGCKHYQPAYETCAELRGRVKCAKCRRDWLISEGVSCPVCSQWRDLVDLSECPKGKPSAACPGREEPVAEHVQRSLFD